MTTFLDVEVDEAIDQLVDDLRKARDIIAEHGIAKGKFGCESGSTCTIGAILQSLGLSCHDDDIASLRVRRAVYALTTTLGDPVDEISSGDEFLDRRSRLYRFNDETFTTEEDVLALFDLTISNLLS